MKSFKKALKDSQVFAAKPLSSQKIDWARIPTRDHSREPTWVMGMGAIACAGLLACMFLFSPAPGSSGIDGQALAQTITQLPVLLGQGGNQ